MALVDGPNEVFMVDRDNTVFHIPGLNFRQRKDLKLHLRDTLLDGVSIFKVYSQSQIRFCLLFSIEKLDVKLA